MDFQQAGAAQGAVDVDGAADAGDAVFGQGDDRAAFLLRVVEKGATTVSRSAAAWYERGSSGP